MSHFRTVRIRWVCLLPLWPDCRQAGAVMVREWDPQTAPSAEIDTMVKSLNAMLAHDLPDDPPWRADAFREYLSVTMPGERRIMWIAESATGGDFLGHANILLFDDMARSEERRVGKECRSR